MVQMFAAVCSVIFPWIDETGEVQPKLIDPNYLSPWQKLFYVLLIVVVLVLVLVAWEYIRKYFKKHK